MTKRLAHPQPRLAVICLTIAVALGGILNKGIEGSKIAAQEGGSERPKKTPGDLPAMATKVAFANLHFDRPVALAYPDDGSNLLFILEQHAAKIWSFPNQAETTDKQLFLDLPSPINRGYEEGLLGLAFHPQYRKNRQFFVYYSANDQGTRRSVVSRFRTLANDPRRADPASEERIWVSAEDPFDNHNGGTIVFGPDGYLYISLGDSGSADDPLSTGQNPKDWFASILRIDVDHPEGGKAYGIPADNPSRRSAAFAAWAPEVYAIGLRNVWKYSFDRQTGELWAGDVGQNLWESIYRIENGGNYGWSIFEGSHRFQPYRRQKRDPASPIRPPIFDYPHAPTADRKDNGMCVTGGYVYRGKAIPELVGVYVFGDFETGRIWGLQAQGDKLIACGELIDARKNPLHIASFGEDPHGELFILAFDGQIYTLVPPGR
ncbi:MAG: PQQ-dependent sugar dehydrogenase [Planctomycetaceae bacterium]|nr:PQQ-dependent sugar dehydrogenase [Planctomycetaceae bacterium]